jgi:hypothetical protein
MKPIPMPFVFIHQRLDLTWPDVAWGFQNGWLDAAGAVDFAVSRLLDSSNASPEELGLASLAQDEFAKVPLLIDQAIKAARPDGDADSPGKWLYLILAWFYEHRGELVDALGVVEELYADFGYPEELRGFVRYLPPADGYEPQAHTYKENRDRLFRKWDSYLKSRTSREGGNLASS